jgi:putative ABC transport system ATP-binding protein
MMGFAVRVEHVSKRYQTAPDQTLNALDDVTFTVDGGDVVALMGPSGSGKSTLLHVLGAMDTIDAGAIHVGEHDVTNLTTARRTSYRRTVGFVFQRFHLLPALSVQDNIAAPLIPYRTDFDKHARARELVRAVGLEGRESALPSRLSGGQQQRVAIARALINQPGLLLADEPTGNLDSTTGDAILQLLLDLRNQHGMTILIATHDVVIADACDHIIRLRDGQIDIAIGA